MVRDEQVRRRNVARALVLLCVLASPPAAFAQAPAASQSATTTEELALPELLDSRPRAQIESDLAAFRTMRANAEARFVDARDLELKAARNIDRNEVEITTLKSKRDLAKKAKEDAEARDLDAQIKKRELIRQFQEKLRAARAAEVEHQAATRDYAASAARACEIELRYADRLSAGLANPRMFQGTRDLEAAALEALQNRANAMSRLADKERTLADRKKQVLESWEKLLR